MPFSWPAGPEDEEELRQIDRDDDMIYEHIEAPKYVDFSAQERSLPPEDASWFCARIGCNQKHEEIDPDTLYKNFVLRVMAARSPNVGLHKSLRQQDQRCPKTVPVKSVHDHRLRFAEKLGNARIKAHPISSLRSTPNPKAKTQPLRCLKGMATPRSKVKVPKETTRESSPVSSSVTKHKKLENSLVFASPNKVQNCSILPPSKKNHSNEATTGSSKGSSLKAKKRELGKPLASHSPKKVWNSSTSRTSHTPKPRLCSATKKLQIDSQSKCNPKHSSKSSKDLQKKDHSNHKIATTSSKSCMEGHVNCAISNKTDKCPGYDAHQEGNAELREIQVDAKSEGSSECVSKNSNTDSSESRLVKHVDVGFDEGNPEGMSVVEVKENASSVKSFDDKENDSETYCNKEIHTVKRLVTENVIAQDCDQSLQKHSIFLQANGKQTASSDNSFDDKENASATYCSRVVHPINRVVENVDSQNCDRSLQKATGGPGKCLYKKMKPTHPKPFRLRTDERGILKEANLEKRIQQEPFKEIKAAVMNPQRKKQLESTNIVNAADLKSESNKPKLQSLHSYASTQRSNGTTANFPVEVRKKERVKKLKVEAAEASTRPLRIRKKPTTIPKEPVFHKIHLPKDCTKRPMQPI